ncbi:unnamed protein product [Cutaneotrichosporon oleaginosum]
MPASYYALPPPIHPPSLHPHTPPYVATSQQVVHPLSTGPTNVPHPSTHASYTSPHAPQAPPIPPPPPLRHLSPPYGPSPSLIYRSTPTATGQLSGPSDGVVGPAPTPQGILGGYADSLNPFERLISHDLLNHLLNPYFEHVFWSNPYPHKPTFYRDIARHREEEPGQEDWTAMVWGMLGLACLLPRHLKRLSVHETQSLLDTCLNQLMSFLGRRDYTSVTHQRVVLLRNGHTAKSRELMGSNLFIALQLKLDREVTYTQYEPIEAEMWRRVWWLLYVTDRSGSTCEGARPVLNEALCQGVRLPSCLDDESLELAAQGRRSWESDPSLQSPMWGFYFGCAMWRVAGKVLTMRERDVATPPAPTDILARVAELDMIIEELDELLLDCPPWLSLQVDREIGSPDLTSGGVSTPVNLTAVEQGIGVQQANLWISQLAIRLLACQYRKELVALRWATPEAAALVSTDPRNPDVIPRRTGFREAKLRENEEIFRDDRDHILSTLLRVLQALPIDQIACNSFPGLQKIQHIAATLLRNDESVLAETGEASGRSHKSLSYLQEYVNYLTRLEAMHIERPDSHIKM